MTSPSFYTRDGFQMFMQVVSQPLLTQAGSAIDCITADYAILPVELQQKIVLLTTLPSHQFSASYAGDIPAVPYIIGDLPAFGEAFRALLLLPALWQHASEVLDTAEVVYHFSNVTNKPPLVGPRLNWHRDFPNGYICPRTSRFVRVLIPLDGMNQHNGCTQIIRNSHLLTDEDALTSKKPSQLEIKPDTVTDILCDRGDVVFLHPKSIHGGGQNQSTRHRRVVIIQFGVAGEPLETNNRESFTEYTYQQMKDI